MNYDAEFDFRTFQNDINGKFMKIYKESIDQEASNEPVSQQVDEAKEICDKINKILSIPEMVPVHAYLYALDKYNVSDFDRQKICRMYDEGVRRGIIQSNDQNAIQHRIKPVDECGDEDDKICGGPADAITKQEMKPVPTSAPIANPTYTVMYSATKDGATEPGEYYADGASDVIAKDDCISNLTKLGYSNIRILGIKKTGTAVDPKVSDATPNTALTDPLADTSLAEAEKKEDNKDNNGNADNGNPPADQNTDQNANQNADQNQGTDQNAQVGSTDAEDEQQETGAQTNPPADQNSGDNQTASSDDGNADNANADQNAAKKDDTADNENQDNQNAAEPEKLTTEQKKLLKDEYDGIFKQVLDNMNLNKCVNDMTIKEKSDFYKDLVAKWTKNDPSEFMSDSEIEKLNKFVEKTETDGEKNDK